MIRPPPRPTRPYTLVPYTPLFRSPAGLHRRDARALPPPPRRADLRPRHGRLADPEPAGHHVLLGAAAGRPQGHGLAGVLQAARSEEHTSELQSLMRISYAVFCLNKKKIESITTKS